MRQVLLKQSDEFQSFIEYNNMEQVLYQKKKEENQELLILFRKLEQLEDSCWNQLFRFEKSDYFVNFEKKYSVPYVINLRLDDFIYLLLLLIEELVFGLLPMDSSSYFAAPYRQSLALFFLTSFIVFISPHWFRWLTLIVICIGYPVLIFLTFNGYFSIMPVDTSTVLINYLGYLTLVPILILLVLIYPIKQFIRNNAGSLYSYIYALALTLILYLWPLYSFIQSGASFSLSFITSNQILIICFIVVVITGFYFFIHHSLFQMKLEKAKSLLLQDFTEGQIAQVLEETEEQHEEQQTCIQRNFNFIVRSMSFVIYALTVGTEIFLYLTLANDFSKAGTIGPIMGYIIIFLLLGAFFMYLPMSKEVFIPFLAILSISTPVLSLLYYNTSTNFYTYAIITLSFPFFALFWSLVKVVSPKRPILRVTVIIGLYIIVYLPAIILALNLFGVFTQDAALISSLNSSFFSIFGGSFLILLIVFIICQICKKRKQGPKEEQKQRVPVDYNYYEQGNPEYQHYQISKLVNVSSISNIDLRDSGFIFCMVFFLICQIMTTHAINQLNTTFASTAFFSPVIHQVIYSQFYTVLMFYLYTHIYLASTGQSSKYFFVAFFVLTAIFFFFVAYFASTGSTLFKITGGFSLFMIFAVLALEAIKSYSQNIFGFVSSMIVAALWIFIMFPYAVMIPFISIYIDQTKFGTFIYGCILATVVLLILMVGILTLVFNTLIDKYEEEKKFKFMTEDVSTLLEEEGVGAQDQELNVLYESFLYRDKKYVFFLKRGYPVNLLKDPDDEITKLVTSQDYKLKRIPTKKEIHQQKERKSSCLWWCLTCFCGEDDEDINDKLTKAKNKMDKEELQSLLPKVLLPGLIKSQNAVVPVKNKKKLLNPSKVFSTRSLTLKDLHSGPKYLGDQYILLKTNKKADVAIQIWHNVFSFAANEDDGESMIISNDFAFLLEAAGVTQLSKGEMDEMFHKYATKKWKDYAGMDLDSFAMAMESLAQRVYNQSNVAIAPQERKFYLLVDKVYYNLASFEEFNNFNFEKRKKKVTKQAIKKSPFQNSHAKYLQFEQENNKEKLQMVERQKKHDRERLVQDNGNQIRFERIKQKQQEPKGKSCKKSLFQKVRACEECCKKETTKQQIQKRLFVKPWNLLAVQVVKILEKKEADWGSSKQESKQHPFRMASNNILMAVFKLVDLYTYVSISLMNPAIGWLPSYGSSSNLYLAYSLQTYAAAAITLISVPLGIRGIMLIFQDRLGLTENRLPASFPHPMFFFTFIYKLLILSLFNLITQTFLDSFNCNWTSLTTPYTLIDDTSVQCFSDSHNRMMLIALAGIITYYPLSSYAMPNFQFAEKSLDLKFRSSYLILYFQANFAMLAGKVLLSSSTNTTVQIVFNGINIGALLLLTMSVLCLKPCLIAWFNYVQLMVICTGLIVNVMGLVLYLTGWWLPSVIGAGCGCLLVILLGIIFIRRRYFGGQVQVQQQADNVQELEMMWMDKQKKNKRIIAFEEKGNNRRNLQAIKGESEVNDVSSDDQTNENKDILAI